MTKEVISNIISLLKKYLDDITNNEQLTKASLTIQSKFNVLNFRAIALYVITFDQMHEVNLEKV